MGFSICHVSVGNPRKSLYMRPQVREASGFGIYTPVLLNVDRSLNSIKKQKWKKINGFRKNIHMYAWMHTAVVVPLH